MKQLSGVILFLVVFFVVGVIMHQALYDRPGVFVWSASEDPESGQRAFGRTTLLPADVKIQNPSGESKSQAAEKKADKVAESKTEEPKTAKKAEDPKAEKPKGDPNVISLLNGKDLGGWEKTQFGGEGDIFIDEEGNLELGFGAVMTGVNWSKDPPATSNYEISLEAMKLDGYDFFLALTFPVKDSHATYVLGGWGGGVVGISSVDDLNASENETMNIEGFEKNKWYKIKVRVTDDKLEAWLDDDLMVDLALKDRKISLLPGDIELSVPIGLASYQTRAQYRKIIWKNLPKSE